MTDARPITALLSEFAELQAVLDDLNVKYVTIAANGHWSFEKLGRTRHGSQPLPEELLNQLAGRIPAGRHARSGEWALRKYDGVAGASVLIERLPIAVADRLPQEVLSTLKEQVKSTGNGMLVGQPGAGKGALLLWLALQIPDHPVLYVAENPPSEFPGNHIMHVFPPSTPQERRALERFVRLSPAVMWDRVASARDLITLFGFPGATRRWFTFDSSSVRSALRMVAGAAANGCDARFSTLLALASSVIGRPEARNLLVRTSSGWEEQFTAADSCLSLLEAYDSNDVRKLGPTEVSTPGTQLSMIRKVEVAEDFAAEAESVASPVHVETPAEVAAETTDAEEKQEAEPVAAQEQQPAEEREENQGLQSIDEDNPRTVPVEMADIDYDDAEEAVTGMLPRDEMRELREQRDARRTDEQDAGSADAPAAPPVGPSKSVPEVTRTYTERPDEIAGDASDESGADEEIPPSPVGDLNLDDLRITPVEKVKDADLELATEIHDDDAYDEAGDMSGVFEGDLDFSNLADEVLEEISEVEAELVEEPRHFGETNPEQRVFISDDDIELLDPDETSEAGENETVAARVSARELAQAMKEAQHADDGTEESTKEFTLNERLLMLRRKRDED